MARKATHKVTFYGVRCYMDDRICELWGCNWLWDLMLIPAVYFHWLCCCLSPGYSEEGFPLVVLEEYKD